MLPLLLRAVITFTAAGPLSLSVKASADTVSLRAGTHQIQQWIGP